jgi:hypothetical protein
VCRGLYLAQLSTRLSDCAKHIRRTVRGLRDRRHKMLHVRKYCTPHWTYCWYAWAFWFPCHGMTGCLHSWDFIAVVEHVACVPLCHYHPLHGHVLRPSLALRPCWRPSSSHCRSTEISFFCLSRSCNSATLPSTSCAAGKRTTEKGHAWSEDKKTSHWRATVYGDLLCARAHLTARYNIGCGSRVRRRDARAERSGHRAGGSDH